VQCKCRCAGSAGYIYICCRDALLLSERARKDADAVADKMFYARAAVYAATPLLNIIITSRRAARRLYFTLITPSFTSLRIHHHYRRHYLSAPNLPFATPPVLFHFRAMPRHASYFIIDYHYALTPRRHYLRHADYGAAILRRDINIFATAMRLLLYSYMFTPLRCTCHAADTPSYALTRALTVIVI